MIYGVSLKELYHAQVLTNTDTKAMVGFAVWEWEPNYKNTIIIDCFCHQTIGHTRRPAGGTAVASLNLRKIHSIGGLGLPTEDQFICFSRFSKERVGYELPAMLQKRDLQG